MGICDTYVLFLHDRIHLLLGGDFVLFDFLLDKLETQLDYKREKEKDGVQPTRKKKVKSKKKPDG